MKTKKTLAFLLACAITVGITAFASCSDSAEESIGHTSSSGSISNDLPSSSSADESVSNTEHDSETNASDVSSVESNSATSATDVSNTENNDSSSSVDDSSPNGGMSEDAKAALKAAVEKLEKSDNYTQNYTMYIKSICEDPDGKHYVEELSQSFIKVDGDKTEIKGSDKQKDAPDGAFTTKTDWRFEEIISKIEEEDGTTKREAYFYYQDENGVWHDERGDYDVYTSESAISAMKIYENLAYDENTGIYTLTDYTYSFDKNEIFESLFGVSVDALNYVSIDHATASYTIYELQIELKDGYISRVYYDIKIQWDISGTYEGSSFVYREESNYNINGTYSDYGTTVVTLPAVIEKIENVELN